MQISSEDLLFFSPKFKYTFYINFKFHLKSGSQSYSTGKINYWLFCEFLCEPRIKNRTNTYLCTNLLSFPLVRCLSTLIFAKIV